MERQSAKHAPSRMDFRVGVFIGALICAPNATACHSAPLPAEKPGIGRGARLAMRCAGSPPGGHCATLGSDSGMRNGLNDKASRRTGIPRPAQGGGVRRRRASSPRREKSVAMVVSLRRRPFGWNAPDYSPRASFGACSAAQDRYGRNEKQRRDSLMLETRAPLRKRA